MSTAAADSEARSLSDGTYALSLSYLKRESALVNDTDTNAWMTHGEEVIRSRAKSAVEIKYLRKPVAIAEAAQLAAQGKKCLSYCELIARDSLLHETQQALSTGRLRSKELG